MPASKTKKPVSISKTKKPSKTRKDSKKHSNRLTFTYTLLGGAKTKSPKTKKSSKAKKSSKNVFQFMKF